MAKLIQVWSCRAIRICVYHGWIRKSLPMFIFTRVSDWNVGMLKSCFHLFHPMDNFRFWSETLCFSCFQNKFQYFGSSYSIVEFRIRSRIQDIFLKPVTTKEKSLCVINQPYQMPIPFRLALGSFFFTIFKIIKIFKGKCISSKWSPRHNLISKTSMLGKVWGCYFFSLTF